METSVPGLTGVGCATFTQRPTPVCVAVDEYLSPFLLGRRVSEIEDIWQSSYVSSYWRSGAHSAQLPQPVPVLLDGGTALGVQGRC